ncbi:MAG: ATP-binding cassette domain-containing protein [Myxococcales bacterium]|nr:ATP-binding cassette domain-containing protein [Myxococcales bacterium]
MIVLDNAQVLGARRQVVLGPVNAKFEAGVHALVGPPRAGAPELLAVLAGAARVHRGLVTVLGEAPRSRAEVTWVRLTDASVPPALTVGELFAAAAALRREAPSPAAGRLERFGLTKLIDRQLASLDAIERHTVLLVEALTSTAKILLLDEPFTHLDARAAGALASALVERSRSACVVVATASRRDAAVLGARRYVMGGTSWLASEGATSVSPAGGYRLVGRGLRALATRLSSDASASAISWHDDALVVRSEDPEALALAVGAAIAELGIDLDLFEPVP